MREQADSWVVFLMTIHKNAGARAVCAQRKWEAMERARPSYHLLIQNGIASEAEAETLARGAPAVAADANLRGKPRKSSLFFFLSPGCCDRAST